MKKEDGITLVALVVSIIVLLILATVSIQVLTGDNGLLTKSKFAVDKYSEGEICEQIKLAYIECQAEKLSNLNINEVEFLKNSLKKKINDNNLTVKVNNGKITVNATINGQFKTYKYNSDTGIAFLDIINYKNKTEENVVPGDDISIGTENFRVFYNKDGIIKAIPWYNIELKLDNPKQSENAETTVFSSTVYWIENGWDSNTVDESANIKMTQKNTDGTYKNNIQQYIEAYGKTLENIGAQEISVRACTKPELDSQLGTELEIPLTDAQKQKIRNVSNNGTYWLGSGKTGNVAYVNQVNNNGNFGNASCNSLRNVRPIIIIEY